MLDEISRRIRESGRELVTQLGEQFDDQGDFVAAADAVRRLKFLDKLQEEINDALMALDS